MSNYKFVLDSVVAIETGMEADITGSVMIDNDKVWSIIEHNGFMLISAGYAWDGCSPKWRIGDWLIGTPDGAKMPGEAYKPYTWRASLVHDFLCQFADHEDMPYNQKQIDEIFYNLMVEDGFRHAKLYYRAVRVYSWFKGLLKRRR